MSHFQAGQVVFGKYHIEELVGSGAFGEVYRVTHLPLNSTRALKILTRQMPGVGTSGFERCRARFQLEARLGAGLNHVNVVKVYDFHEDGDVLGLEMEYLSRGNLSGKIREYRRRKQTMPLMEIIKIGSQISEGLVSIHKARIVHRDLTPNNLLFDENGVVKISDLGLAYLDQADFSQRAELGSLSERHPGTPRYMSPEQENSNGHLTPTSDIYSFGLILFELLSGKSYKDCKPGITPGEMGRSIPKWLNRLVQSMLSKDPESRPMDGQAVCQEFRKHTGAAGHSANIRPATSLKTSLFIFMGILSTLACIGVGTLMFNSSLKSSLGNLLNGINQPEQEPITSAVSLKMSGDFRVAVAEFTIVGSPENPDLGKELAAGVYQRLEQNYAEVNPDFSITIWGPDKIRGIQGDTTDARLQDATRLTNEIGADILVYGIVDVTQPVWQAMPEFFISSESFYQAAEVNGPERLGAVFNVAGSGETAHRLEFSSQITPRIEILAPLTIGLAYMSARNYDKAIQQFHSIESMPEWTAYENKEILYLLIGNAALNSYNLNHVEQTNLTLAEENYLRSLQIDPGYSRALIGLAGTYYLRAQLTFSTSGNPADIDQAFLEKSILTFQQSASAPNQPVLADIPVKVHFGLGQAYLLEALSGKANSLSAAVVEFSAVVSAYADGANPRVREITAESHARLGLIATMAGNGPGAFKEYNAAADLLFDNPGKQDLYKKRAMENQ